MRAGPPHRPLHRLHASLGSPLVQPKFIAALFALGAQRPERRPGLLRVSFAFGFIFLAVLNGDALASLKSPGQICYLTSESYERREVNVVEFKY